MSIARLPRAYDPRHPAGLLVWVDASPSGQPPHGFHFLRLAQLRLRLMQRFFGSGAFTELPDFQTDIGRHAEQLAIRLAHLMTEEFNDALDHLAGFLLEQTFAVALAHDCPNFLFDRFLVGALLGTAKHAMQQRIDPAGTPHQRHCQPSNRSPQRPG